MEGKVINVPKTFEDIHLERDAILAGLLHHYGPEGVSNILNNLEAFKAYVEKQRLEKVKDPPLDPDDIQLLAKLKVENVCDGILPLISKGDAIRQAFKLSDLGYIAMEQRPNGLRLHITRLGIHKLEAAILQAVT